MNRVEETQARLILERVVVEYADRTLVDQLGYVSSLSRDENASMFFNINLRTGYATSKCPNGPLNIRAEYTDEKGEVVGFVLVFIDHGVLSHIEAPWTTEEIPSSWPTVDAVKIMPVS